MFPNEKEVLIVNRKETRDQHDENVLALFVPVPSWLDARLPVRGIVPPLFLGEEMGESRIHERAMVALVWVWNPLNVYDLHRF